MIRFSHLNLKDKPESKGLNIKRTVRALVLPFSLMLRRDFFMLEKRLAIISIIVEDRQKSSDINSLLSAFGDCVVGRMGIPYKERGVSVMCVVVDAPVETINTLTGKLGMLSGVTAKTLTSKI